MDLLNFSHKPTSSELVEKIRLSLPDFLNGKRLEHTFFVEKEAISIAEKLFWVYNISDEYKNDLRAAALLHDITKQFTFEKQLELCKKYKISVGDASGDAIIHGKTAAHLARELFSINDVVFSAVYNHTTGKEDMNVFDKIIFLADYIEPSRKHEHCMRTRRFFYENTDKKTILDQAILMSINGTLGFLLAEDKQCDIQTVLTRNSILSSLGKQN